MTDQPLPGLEGFAPRPRRQRSQREEERASRPTWSTYSVQGRMHCFDCVQMIVDGHDVVPRRASWIRRVEGEPDRLFCAEHAQVQRAREDGAFL